MKLQDFIKSLTKGAFVNVELLSTPKMSKTRRVDKAVNPFFDRLQKKSIIRMATTGVSYEGCVDGSLSRKGIDIKYESEKPKGMHWVEPNLILESDTTAGQFYFRITMNKTTRTDVVYILDGVEVTDEETINAIKEWVPESKECAKQKEAGLERDEQIRVVSPKFETIVSIEQGNAKWHI